MEFAQTDLDELTNNMADMLIRGHSLSQTMIKTKRFPSFYIQWIAIAEKTNHLEKALKSLIEYYEFKIKHRKKVLQAILYPIIVFFFSMIAMFYLTINVFPVFLGFLEDQPYALWPLTTRIVYRFSILIQTFYPILLAAGVFLVLFYILSEQLPLLKYKKSKFFFDKGLVTRVSKVKYERDISYMLFLMLDSGISFQDSINILSQTHENLYVREFMLKIVNDFKHGHGTAESLRRSRLFSHSFITILSHNLYADSALSGMKRIYHLRDLEYSTFMETKVKLLEPILIIFVSLIIGILMIATITPLFNTLNYF